MHGCFDCYHFVVEGKGCRTKDMRPCRAWQDAEKRNGERGNGSLAALMMLAGVALWALSFMESYWW